MKNSKFVIPKSRYDSVSTYLSPEGAKYNDIEVVQDKEIFQQLRDAGKPETSQVYDVISADQQSLVGLEVNLTTCAVPAYALYVQPRI